MDTYTYVRAVDELARELHRIAGQQVWDKVAPATHRRWRKRADEVLRACPTLYAALNR